MCVKAHTDFLSSRKFASNLQMVVGFHPVAFQHNAGCHGLREMFLSPVSK